MTSQKVIIFGPTGAVGSAAARTAASLGASVSLAMRDTQKPIPGLDEAQGHFTRVAADLTKPETIRSALQTSGAKHAFIYAVHGSTDGMAAALAALAAGGVELVVFLSSFSVVGDDLAAIPQSEIIPYLHARVEINGREAFGDRFVAVRPAAFASNSVQYAKEIGEGAVKVFKPEFLVDNIASEDIGRVCGTILAKGPQDGERAIYLVGPKLRSLGDSVKTIAKALGKEVKIEETTADAFVEQMTAERGMPKPFAEYMAKVTAGGSSEGQQVMGYPVHDDWFTNIEKYSGKKATTLEEWAAQNKQLFAA